MFLSLKKIFFKVLRFNTFRSKMEGKYDLEIDKNSWLLDFIS